MKKYTFQTIVAPEFVRNEFTQLRDSLNTSDKELMYVIWTIASGNPDEIRNQVDRLREAKAEQKAAEKAAKAAEKAVRSAVQKAAKKAAKKVANKAAKKPANKAAKK